ncbi:HNH endonuclease [Rhodococcus sp. HS-D2]|uniref:HNH endonuclease n=1 Tax=Rhodococcus sp. HS-D2 TaxID=1384636 RepID=UPI0009EE6F49|nr:HNH endonuclease signature motif containing protein [Rhodococcus sp. HS-D2]
MTTERSVALRRRHRRYIARNKPPCHLCGEPINYDLKHPDPMSFVVDHVIAISRGGSDDLDNKAASHKVCNESRGNRDIDTWRGTVAPPPRSYVTWRTW